jgi:hypothetical protein
VIVFFGKHEIINQWIDIFQGEKLVAFCENYQELSMYSPEDTIVIYVKIQSNASLKIALKLKLKGYRVCKWWAGTDCRYLNDANYIKRKLSKWLYKYCLFRSFSSADWLSDTLLKCGINTCYLHTSTPVFLLKEQLNVKNIPDKPAEIVSHVLIYSNPDRHWIYNTEMMLKLVDEMPSISFTFVGDPSLSLEDKPNANSLGRVSPEELFTLYRSNDVLVRITSHDALARMVIEAMYFGMHVITNWPVANVHQCETLEQIKSVLSTKLAFNQQGYDYVREELNTELWKTRLFDLVNDNRAAD